MGKTLHLFRCFQHLTSAGNVIAMQIFAPLSPSTKPDLKTHTGLQPPQTHSSPLTPPKLRLPNLSRKTGPLSWSVRLTIDIGRGAPAVTFAACGCEIFQAETSWPQTCLKWVLNQNAAAQIANRKRCDVAPGFSPIIALWINA